MTRDSSTRPRKSGPETPRVDSPARRRESARDFVEQVVVAFILAFLVRGFEAEAFVIPTGSMAPTLMGMHKEVACPHCGFVFPVNASEEFDPRRHPELRHAPRIVAGFCGNCRAPVRIDEQPSFNGDRILVMKSLYNLPLLHNGGPDRWDVVVFHYPEEPETNYIKRLVGMPDEDLRIYFGDILTRPGGSAEPHRLERKPLRHQVAMLQNVWDDRYRPRALADRPEWQRWGSSLPGAWSEPEPGRFVAKGAGSDWAVLRYRHLVPDADQWEAILRGEPNPTPPRPSLVSDFYSYNSGTIYATHPHEQVGPHWVGDLAVEFRVESKSDAGQVRVELVRGGVPNRVEIDLATGLATLSHGDDALGDPVETDVKGQGTHDLRFANIDGRLTLWVDGSTPFGAGVEFEDGSRYEEHGHAIPTAADLAPAGVAARGGADVVVSDLVLKRDIYYTLEPGGWDYVSLGLPPSTTLSDPALFPALENVRWADFPIQPAHYMMLGDNSPRSKDGRGWGLKDRVWDHGNRKYWEVPEALLIGKAFFIYWPHGKPIWPGFALNRDFRVPFRPYVERMKWIH